MENEALYRFTVFVGVFVLMALVELLLPKRSLDASKVQRWVTNISIGGIDSFLIRLLGMISLPIVAIAAAAFAEVKGVGLFHYLDLPFWIEIILSLVLLDFAIYLQHVAFHKIPLLWRLHQVHHSDVDIDVSTAIRFHPIEIGLSMFYKVAWVLVFGIDGLAVLLFEIGLNGLAMFNHSNVALPKLLDRILRLFIVTPDMHRVHHSIKPCETDSNYGFNLSLWDRLFGTYTDQPEGGHEKMVIGLQAYRGERPTGFWWSLLLPFRKQ